MREQRFSVVVPTTGGPGLTRLVGALADGFALADRAALDLHEVVVVDDRPGFPAGALPLPEPGPLKEHLRIVATGGRGAAAARNAGWRSTSVPWVVFLTDDTELREAWADDLVTGLEGAAPSVDVLTSRTGSTVTDVAYRREHLQQTHGFDERADTPAAAGRSLTTPLLLGALSSAAAGLLVRRVRVPAFLAAAGLGVAAAVLPSSPGREEATRWPPAPRAVLFAARLEADSAAAVEAARRAGLEVGFVADEPGGAAPILAAARALGVEPYACGFVGDLPADALAAYAAGARPILVPAEETDDGLAETADDLVSAVEALARA